MAEIDLHAVLNGVDHHGGDGMITERELTNIRARLDAVPEGPWELRCAEGWWISRDGMEDVVVDHIGWESEDHTAPVGDFLVNAIHDIPALLDEVERLRDNLGIVHASDLAEGWELLVAENRRLKAQIELARNALANTTEATDG